MSCHTPPHLQPECCALGSGLLSDAEANRYATTFKVLGEPARLTILSHLAAAGCPPTDVTALTEMLGMSQSTVSYHLKKLCDAGLLTAAATAAASSTRPSQTPSPTCAEYSRSGRTGESHSSPGAMQGY